jgi:hypothetical protein
MRVVTIEQNSDYPESMKNPYYHDCNITAQNVAYKRGQDSVYNHAFLPDSLTKAEKLSLLEAMGIPVDEFLTPNKDGNKFNSLREFIERGK